MDIKIMETDSENPYVDIHCHSSMKPFCQACPGNTNSEDASLINSIWHDDPPTDRNIRQNKALSVTRFSQANFTSLFQGNFKVVVVALNPPEKGFFPKFETRPYKTQFRNFLDDFVTGIGIKKIIFIQKNKDDFNELNCEYDFYKQLNGIVLTIYGKKVCYKLTSKYSDIENNVNSKDDIISVVLSIEGANLFSNNNSIPPPPGMILSNIDKVKRWDHPPFFVTFCHHFYNYLAGHASSLPDFIKKKVDESTGLDTDIVPDGIVVIKHLLSTTNGRRIYIDIKHMSRKSRYTYYQILENDYRNEKIPIIVSHGALNGYPVLDPAGPTPKERNGLFNGRDINFYDDEIVRIAKSGGIFGLQMDKRLITNKCEKRKIKYLCWSKKKQLKRWMRLVWNQIRHIADLLDNNNLPAWDIICLGTDFDGIIDPVDRYWTSAELRCMYKDLLDYADEYVAHKSFRIATSHIAPKDILEKVFSKNAINFLKKYY
jgi:Membrane dipeptidase (Peptidase family M19)